MQISQSLLIHQALEMRSLQGKGNPAVPPTVTDNHNSENYLDVHSLDQAVNHYFTLALSASTHKIYKAVDRRYSQFCTDFSLTPFSTSESSLCYFATCMAQQGLIHSTNKTYLYELCQMQVAMGLGDPDLSYMPQLRQVLKGILVDTGKQRKAAQAQLPITPGILRKMKAIRFQSGKPYKSVMLWAASTTNFFPFAEQGDHREGL